MSRSFFLVPPSSFVVCPFWTKVVFFFPPLRFLWPFVVVVVVFWPLPRFSPFVVAVLLSCPVRTTTKEMDHNFVSLSLCVASGMDGRGNWTEKKGKNSQRAHKRCGCGRGRLCGAPLSYPSSPLLYLLLFSS
jgi:hypothetical protein